MKTPLIIASGEHMMSFLLISLPAAILGIGCLAAAVILNLTRPEKSVKAQVAFVISGLALLVLAVIGPAFVPF